MTQKGAPSIFLLHLEGAGDVRLFRDRELAESSMEVHDLEQWTVYDAEGYRHALSARGDGAVEIGPRVGGLEMNEVLRHLRQYLESAEPKRHWEDVSFEEMMAAAEKANRKAEAIDARRRRKIVLVLVLIGLPLLTCFAARRLAGH